MNKDQKQIAEAEREIEKLIKHPGYRATYIFGMLHGLQAGFRTVEDVCDRILKLLNDADRKAEVCPLCLEEESRRFLP